MYRKSILLANIKLKVMPGAIANRFLLVNGNLKYVRTWVPK